MARIAVVLFDKKVVFSRLFVILQLWNWDTTGIQHWQKWLETRDSTSWDCTH